ncbi:MAG: hypothetical protein ABJC13_08540 [Acidobacteriota bacterium]
MRFYPALLLPEPTPPHFRPATLRFHPATPRRDPEHLRSGSSWLSSDATRLKLFRALLNFLCALLDFSHKWMEISSTRFYPGFTGKSLSMAEVFSSLAELS